MRVLVACEWSGAVRDAFRKRGHDAWSCDLSPCTGNSPWHYRQDVTTLLDDGWDIMIAFPPCTHLATSGARHFAQKRADGRQQAGIDFFMAMTDAPAPRLCVENPVGIMSTVYRKPDQVIQPYYFGDKYQKTTCLWLKGLPRLEHYEQNGLWSSKTHVDKGEMTVFKSGRRMPKWYAELSGKGAERGRTFQGIADAMAEQWGGLPPAVT